MYNYLEIRYTQESDIRLKIGIQKVIEDEWLIQKIEELKML